MTDAKHVDRTTRPFGAADARRLADALTQISTAVGRAGNHLDQYAFDPADAKTGETLRGLLRHTTGCINEIVGMMRQFAAGKDPDRRP